MRVRLALTALVLSGCSAATAPTAVVALPLPLESLLAQTQASRWLASGDDQWEVWVCRVPLDTVDALYARSSLRLQLVPDQIVGTLNRFVGPYFDALSHGGYHPRFVAGGDYEMGSGDEPQACLDAALDRSAGTARGIIAVADAEHALGASGGSGTQGGPCAAPPCPASTTRRAVYVGASDFHPSWGDRPPMDLVEHEMGHALGWPHSGYDPSAAQPYLSALDVMSNSAAPRGVDPQRRDAPDTLALDRLIAGWLPRDAVVAVPPDGGEVALVASSGTRGHRLAVVDIDATTFLTVEVLSASGLDSHLPHAGVAVHRVTFDGMLDAMEPLVGESPFTDLLEPGESITVDGWILSVLDRWRLRIEHA